MNGEILVKILTLSIPLSIITYTITTLILKNDKDIKIFYAIIISSFSGLSSLVIEVITTGFGSEKIPIEKTFPLFLILYTTQFYILDKLRKTIKTNKSF